MFSSFLSLVFKEWCNNKGGYMVTIETELENTWVRLQIRAAGKPIYFDFIRSNKGNYGEYN